MTTKEEARYFSDKATLDEHGKENMTIKDLKILRVLPENYDKWKKNIYPENLSDPSKEVFLKFKKILMKYLDTSQLNYNLLSIWTLGTYFHNQFETYPLLTIMARKQSGKTRTLKLISSLACGSDGSTSTSITETFLFRHKLGAIFFDEMESISSKEKSALRETINSVYKKGNKIVRFREIRKEGIKDYIEEAFYPFYPLGLANINGFGDVLTDRSLQLILQRSYKSQTKLIEDFSTNKDISELKKELMKMNARIPKNIFSEWNRYIRKNKCSDELLDIIEAISKTDLGGRPLEIFFPLFVVADLFDVLDVLIESAKEYLLMQEGEFVDNIDDLLQNFMDGYKGEGFLNLSRILSDFRSSLENPEEWINSKWLGRALKRLGLIEKKRLVNGRVQCKLKNNSTNTTYSINTTNTTNSTKNEVELVELVDKKELVENIKQAPELQEDENEDN